MMSDAEQPLGYAAAVDAYQQAGWVGVLPMDRGAKVWPPTIKCPDARAKKPGHNKDTCTECISYSGHRGIDPSSADIAAWREQFPDGNLCLRMPVGVIAIDVDHYGAKTGGKALAEAVRRWGPLPSSPRSSSREGDYVSGIRLFRVAPGTVLRDRINFPELGIGDIEICQHHHRYVIAWPSIHPEGGQYWWRNDANQYVGIPVVDELPWLPPRWIDGLRKDPVDLTGDAGFDVRPTLTAGEPSIAVQQRVQQAIKEVNLPGTSRHDTMRKHVLALMRMGKSGEPGVGKSLQLLCDVFVAATSVDHSRHPDVARAEFVRMVTGDTAARELSRPGAMDWFNALLPKDSTPSPGGDEGVETGATAETGSLEVQRSVPRSPLEDIEQGFWESRESLRMVWTTARASMCPPWAVLGVCAARALAQVRPHITLPPLIGRRGSLNFFAAIVSGPAGGKTTSVDVAEHLVPGHILTCQQGTGEGILATFGRAADPSDPNSLPEFEAVMLDVDEIDSLMGISGRAGSTTMPLLRSAFSGATLAFSYSNKDKRRYIRKHTYRMTAVIGIQPKRAGAILAESDGGTPQRFLWFPATDSRVSRDRPWATGPLQLPRPGEWLYPMEIQIPRIAEDLIVDEHVKRQQGGQDALDGHALFCREKFAYALTVLDGRIMMNEQDWELSGIAADISLHTREMVLNELHEAAQSEAVDRGEVRGIELAAAESAKAEEHLGRVQRILRWVLSTVDAAGEEGIPNRELNRRMAHRDRRYFDRAINHAAASGLIRQLDGTTSWVKI